MRNIIAACCSVITAARAACVVVQSTDGIVMSRHVTSMTSTRIGSNALKEVHPPRCVHVCVRTYNAPVAGEHDPSPKWRRYRPLHYSKIRSKHHRALTPLQSHSFPRGGHTAQPAIHMADKAPRRTKAAPYTLPRYTAPTVNAGASSKTM
jgi:hypothetical protein